MEKVLKIILALLICIMCLCMVSVILTLFSDNPKTFMDVVAEFLRKHIGGKQGSALEQGAALDVPYAAIFAAIAATYCVAKGE